MNSETDQVELESFTDDFLMELPEFVEYLYTDGAPLCNQVERLIFCGAALNSDPRGAN